MALLFYSQFDDPVDWGKHLRNAMPGLDFRVWPVFNLADASISCGVIALLLWQKKFFPKKERTITATVETGAVVDDSTQVL